METRQTVQLTQVQRETAACSHTDETKTVTPSGTGCKECLEMGDTWVHLRVCPNCGHVGCGHVGCCDSPKNKHATKHFYKTQHPIVRSFEPGEAWAYCYKDEALF